MAVPLFSNTGAIAFPSVGQNPADRCHQIVDLKGFCQKRVGPCQHHLLNLIRKTGGRKGNDGHVAIGGWQGTDAAGQFNAAQFRHLHVAEDHVGIVVGNLFQCFQRVGHHLHMDTFAFHDPADQIAGVGAVINQHHPFSGCVQHRQFRHLNRQLTAAIYDRQGQVEPEGRALLRGAVDLQIAAHAAHQPL